MTLIKPLALFLMIQKRLADIGTRGAPHNNAIQFYVKLVFEYNKSWKTGFSLIPWCEDLPLKGRFVSSVYRKYSFSSVLTKFYSDVTKVTAFSYVTAYQI